MLKILHLTKKIISIKWKLTKPKKKRFLIYNGICANVLYKIIKIEESEILHVRFESINLFILFFTFCKSGFKNLKMNYKINYIKHVNPKFVVTNIDNDPSFYKLKNIFPSPCYISIQAGMRTTKQYYVLFDKNQNLKPLNVDHLFVFGKSIKEKILENFKFNITITGSVLNNYYKKSNNIKTENSILFISQTNLKEWNNLKKIPENEKIIFNLLYKFCKTKNLELHLLPKNIIEKNYRKDLIKGDWKYINTEMVMPGEVNKDGKTSFSFVDNHKMVVFLYSTLGYELLARGVKCASFSYGSLDISWGKKNKAFPIIPFGSLQKFENTGPFWTNEMDEELINKTLHNVYNFSDKEWIETTEEIMPEIMHYDPGNSLIKKVLNSK